MSKKHSTLTTAECERLDREEALRRTQESCSHRWAEPEGNTISCWECEGVFPLATVVVKLMHRISDLEERIRET